MRVRMHTVVVWLGLEKSCLKTVLGSSLLPYGPLFSVTTAGGWHGLFSWIGSSLSTSFCLCLLLLCSLCG